MTPAFIFDLDGTIYPRRSLLYRTMSSRVRDWFKSRCKIPDADFDGFYDALRESTPNPFDAIADLGLSVEDYHTSVFETINPDEHLAADHLLRVMLDDLRSTKFIVTQSSRGHAMCVLRALGLEGCFHDVYIRNVNWHTPDKLDAYETIVRKHGLERSKTLVVGDNPSVDLRAAQAAGYPCILVSDQAVEGFRSVHSVLAIRPLINELSATFAGADESAPAKKHLIKMEKREIDELHAAFSRTTDEIFSLKEWDALLQSGKKLRVKYGVDVTAPYLHIGHAVNLWMMRRLQNMGHKIIFLIGDFTTQIGDPTGKNKTRPILPAEEIEDNIAKFIEQARMVLRFDDDRLLEIRRNSEWFGRMGLPDFLKLMSMVTHARLVSREMFQKRMADNADIYMHELIYPILQGYDSFMLEADLTIIGSDQLFNEMMGRFYQERFGQTPQVIITTKITPGIDGVFKQSKSLDNYIGLGHSPRDKFGRLMRLPDSLIHRYFEIYTGLPDEDLKAIPDLVAANPMEAKKQLASAIVTRYHDALIAQEERNWFEATFSRKETPADIPEVSLSASTLSGLEIVRLCFGPEKSNSEIRRLFQQGAVSMNEEKFLDPSQTLALKDGDVLQIGKRSWFQIRMSEDR